MSFLLPIESGLWHHNNEHSFDTESSNSDTHGCEDVTPIGGRASETLNFIDPLLQHEISMEAPPLPTRDTSSFVDGSVCATNNEMIRENEVNLIPTNDREMDDSHPSSDPPIATKKRGRPKV